MPGFESHHPLKQHRPKGRCSVICALRARGRRCFGSVALADANAACMPSRQARQCSPATLQFYRYTAGVFLDQLQTRGVTSPQEITARHVREHLAELVRTGKSDTSVHDHARAVKTLLRFWHQEGCLPAPIMFIADSGPLRCGRAWISDPLEADSYADNIKAGRQHQ